MMEIHPLAAGQDSVQLPTELWRHTLCSKVLYKGDISNCTLVCRTFREIAQPLLFYKLSVTLDRRRPAGYCDRVLQRLVFVRTTDRLATAVEQFLFFGVDTDTLSPTIESIFLALIEVLPRLKNIRYVSLQNVTIPDPLLALILQLPIERALILNCGFEAQRQDLNLIPHMPLKSLVLRENQPPKLLSSLVVPSLHEMSLTFAWGASYASEFLHALSNPSPMRFLVRLTLQRDVLYNPAFLEAMRGCDGVTTLTLEGHVIPDPQVHLSVLPMDVLPRLTSLRGNIEDVEVFAGHQLFYIHISLDVFQDRAMTARFSLIRTLFPAVSALEIAFQDGTISDHLLFQFLNGFEHLRHFKILCALITAHGSPGECVEDAVVSTESSIRIIHMKSKRLVVPPEARHDGSAYQPPRICGHYRLSVSRTCGGRLPRRYHLSAGTKKSAVEILSIVR